MNPAYFENGQHQDLYFPEGHPHAGFFNGMAVILEERGYIWAHDLRAECKKFKCPLLKLAGKRKTTRLKAEITSLKECWDDEV